MQGRADIRRFSIEGVMITLRCTRKLLKLVGGVTVEDPPAPTSVLGNWYANVIPTVAGELIVFANERTLLSVALPIELLAEAWGLWPRTS